jgi:hypothetical protein
MDSTICPSGMMSLAHDNEKRPMKYILVYFKNIFKIILFSRIFSSLGSELTTFSEKQVFFP